MAGGRTAGHRGPRAGWAATVNGPPGLAAWVAAVGLLLAQRREQQGGHGDDPAKRSGPVVYRLFRLQQAVERTDHVLLVLPESGGRDGLGLMRVQRWLAGWLAGGGLRAIGDVADDFRADADLYAMRPRLDEQLGRSRTSWTTLLCCASAVRAA